MERFVRTQAAREVESLGPCVEGNYPRGTERLQDLDTKVAETAHAEHDGVRPRVNDRQKLFDRVIGSDARVGEWRQRSWIGARRQLDHGPRGRPEIFGIATVGAIEAWEEARPG